MNLNSSSNVNDNDYDNDMNKKRLIPYLPLDVTEPKEIVDKIRDRRGPTGLLNLDRILLHVPFLAEGWNSFFGAIRNKVDLPGQPKELAICFIAILNRAPYEFEQHAPVYLEEGGLQEKLDFLPVLDKCIRLQDQDSSTSQKQLFKIQSYEDIPLYLSDEDSSSLNQTYTAFENLVLQLTIEMTLFARSPSELLLKLKEDLGSEKQLIELVMVISGYNCCSRFLVGMDIHGPDGIT